MLLQNILCLAERSFRFLHQVLYLNVPPVLLDPVSEITDCSEKKDAAKPHELEGEVIVNNVLEGVETIHISERDIVDVG